MHFDCMRQNNARLTNAHKVNHSDGANGDIINKFQHHCACLKLLKNPASGHEGALEMPPCPSSSTGGDNSTAAKGREWDL